MLGFISSSEAAIRTTTRLCVIGGIAYGFLLVFGGIFASAVKEESTQPPNPLISIEEVIEKVEGLELLSLEELTVLVSAANGGDERAQTALSSLLTGKGNVSWLAPGSREFLDDLLAHGDLSSGFVIAQPNGLGGSELQRFVLVKDGDKIYFLACYSAFLNAHARMVEFVAKAMGITLDELEARMFSNDIQWRAGRFQFGRKVYIGERSELYGRGNISDEELQEIVLPWFPRATGITVN